MQLTWGTKKTLAHLEKPLWQQPTTPLQPSCNTNLDNLHNPNSEKWSEH
jgi:hypothetical protein